MRAKILPRARGDTEWSVKSVKFEVAENGNNKLKLYFSVFVTFRQFVNTPGRTAKYSFKILREESDTCQCFSSDPLEMNSDKLEAMASVWLSL